MFQGTLWCQHINGFSMLEDDLRILNKSERRIRVKLFALATQVISERPRSPVEILKCHSPPFPSHLPLITSCSLHKFLVFFCCICAYTLAPCLHNCFRMSTRNGKDAFHQQAGGRRHLVRALQTEWKHHH